jgi:hypothetical protein
MPFAFGFSCLILFAAVTAACRPDVPCAHVPRCDSGKLAILEDFKVSNVPGIVPAKQSTSVRICYDQEGFKLNTIATDSNIFSPYTQCNSEVWVNSDVLEVFMAPVQDATQNPIWYHETDTSASGAVWAGHINNTKGNWSNCNDISCTPGPLPCTGLGDFDSLPGLHAHVTNYTEGWRNQLSIPFELFPKEYATGKFWRANFYRYDYPWGDKVNYELSGWSPTHDPSFHIPARFGVLVLDE